MAEWNRSMLLLACRQMNEERSLQAVIHLLKGRKSHQVMQDASLFGTSLLYGELRKLPKEEIEGELHSLNLQGYIQIHSRRSVGCTEEGERICQQWLKKMGLESCLKAVHSVGQKEGILQFWLHLELLVQTLSYMSQGDSFFYPVIEQWSIREEVKKFFYQGGNVKSQSAQLKKELAKWLKDLQEWEQKILLLRWSGKGKAGLTFPQIGEILHQPSGWVRFQLYRLIAEKITNLYPDKNSILYQLAYSQQEPQGLSQSARITRRYLGEGMDLQGIASTRGLRMGTIEDHIVEIALVDPAFSITPFVEQEKVKRVYELIKNHGTRKLGELKRIAGDEFSFLEIRLVSARGAVKIEGE